VRARLLLAVALLAAGCSKLTADNYAKVKLGMTYAEASAILGRPDSCSEAIGFKSCRWGDERRYAVVRFAGETVILHQAENIR
jgi:hypothetical protein